MGVRELSWEPIRQGAIYCSPGCGGGCKWKDYEAAVKAASALAKRLGPGWVPRVHENLGWHFCVHDENQLMKVHQSGPKDYWTLFSSEPGIHGNTGWSGKGKTPEQAIQMSKDLAMKQMLSIARVLNVTIHDADGNVLSGEE